MIGWFVWGVGKVVLFLSFVFGGGGLGGVVLLLGSGGLGGVLLFVNINNNSEMWLGIIMGGSYLSIVVYN